MIYMDSAATTKYKPEIVYDAFNYYVREIGVSPGRGSYRQGIEASRMLFQTRKTVGDYFGLKESTNVVFTKNSTEAINLFFNGFLKQGDHVIISCYEHNAVLRPLHTLKEQGIIDYSIIDRDDLLNSPDDILDKYQNKKTRLLACTLASNLTGRIIFSPELMLAAKQHGLTTFLDSSQGAGKIKVNMQNDAIDYLAFTGHKDLMALPGVGGLCCISKEGLIPLIQGGTGVLGDSYTNPDVFPEGLEAGTLNMPAIWSLKASIEYLEDHQSENCQKEKELLKMLIEGLKQNPKIKIYDEEYDRVGTVGINIEGISSDKLVRLLDENDIAVRGGIHCAILAHKSLGTEKTGIVRLSLSPFNSKEDVEKVIEVLQQIGG